MKTSLNYLLKRFYLQYPSGRNLVETRKISKFVSVLKQTYILRRILNVSIKLKNIKRYFLAIYRHSIQFVVVKLAEITHFPRGGALGFHAGG